MAALNPGEFPYASGTILPVELVDSLNQVYFLHRLATEPEKVIPPGKTLLSMMIQSQMDSEKGTQKQETNLMERIKEVAHRAFWNEVRILVVLVPERQTEMFIIGDRIVVVSTTFRTIASVEATLW